MFIKKRKKVAVDPSELRAHQRVATEAEVTIDSDHNFYFGLSENISEGGLFVCTYQGAQIGRDVDLTFTLPSQPEPFRVRARVQWIREYSPATSDVPPGIGLQFIDPPSELVLAVRQFIESREPTFYE